MCGQRPTLGLLLRLGILLTALCVCIHLYLDWGWRGAARGPAPPASRKWAGHARTQPVSDSEDQDTSVRRRVSYVRSPKKDNVSQKSGGQGEDPAPPCCPLHHPHRKASRWHIDLEPWASHSHSLEDEARRFLSFITSPQLSCPSLHGVDAVQRGSAGDWAVCLDPAYSLLRRMNSKHCRVYSFGLGVVERPLEALLAASGCEVHCFDPSLKLPHRQHQDMWLHRLSVDWRDPSPAVLAQRQLATTKKLAAILNDFGHREVDVLKADMESAEWKILENLILEGVLDSVGQLLLELHLHWAGFEVSGDEPAVVRYWFSLLKELERAHFRLFHVGSDSDKPRLFLHKNIFNASSTYTLGWVNTQWKAAGG